MNINAEISQCKSEYRVLEQILYQDDIDGLLPEKEYKEINYQLAGLNKQILELLCKKNYMADKDKALQNPVRVNKATVNDSGMDTCLMQHKKDDEYSL